MLRPRPLLIAAVVVPFVLASLAAVGGGAVMLLWNWLIPSIVGWRALTFWEALGLLALCRILFGGFGGPRGPRFGSHWSRDERARFREAMMRRFHGGPPTGSGAPSPFSEPSA